MAQITELSVSGVPGRRHTFLPKTDAGGAVDVPGWELAERDRTWLLMERPREWELPERPA